VLEFLSHARRFERLDYVSTAYVSGRAKGVFHESDLDVGQSFKNHYEETKYLAELEVVKSGLPRAIYRPGIVVGDRAPARPRSSTGPITCSPPSSGFRRRGCSCASGVAGTA
jgi:thioester reductase-like protein